MLLNKLHSTLLLTIVIVSLLSVLPSGASQTNFSTLTLTGTYTSQSTNATVSFTSTVTSIITSTSSLMVNQTTSIYSTINSTSTVTTSTPAVSNAMAASPTLDTNSIILIVVNVLIAVFLIFAVIRYVKRRRK